MDIIKRLYNRLKRRVYGKVNVSLIMRECKFCTICGDDDNINSGVIICKNCTLKIIDKTINIDRFFDRYRVEDGDNVSYSVDDLSLFNYEFEK